MLALLGLAQFVNHVFLLTRHGRAWHIQTGV